MKMILKSIVLICVIITSSFGVDDVNITTKNKLEITKINDDVKIINDTLKDNIWISKYKTYLTYRSVEEELVKLTKFISLVNTKYLKNEYGITKAGNLANYYVGAIYMIRFVIRFLPAPKDYMTIFIARRKISTNCWL
jgi:uncharacterized protein YxeA